MKPTSRELRMEKVLDISEQIFLNNPTATLEEIAHKSGVGAATLYRYYENRDGLVRAVFIRILDLQEQVQADLVVQNKGFFDAIELLVAQAGPYIERMKLFTNDSFMFEYAKALQPLMGTMLRIKKKFDTVMIDSIEYSKKIGEIDKDMPSEWINCVGINTFFSFMEYVGEGKDPVSAKKLLEKTLKTGLKK
jgi:AcrR family transcriptional regulator